jgi:hypothetical protein
MRILWKWCWLRVPTLAFIGIAGCKFTGCGCVLQNMAVTGDESIRPLRLSIASILALFGVHVSVILAYFTDAGIGAHGDLQGSGVGCNNYLTGGTRVA